MSEIERRRIAMAVRRLYPMLNGHEVVDKSLSTRGRGGIVMREPIQMFLLDTSEGWVLFDAGANPTLVRDPALKHRYYTGQGWEAPDLPEDLTLPHHLARLGLMPRDVAAVVVSHLHLDHSGALPLLTHCPVYIQRDEYDYAFGEADEALAYFRVDYAEPTLDWRIIDGDQEVLAGVTAIKTRGHTPGHQSLVVELPNSGMFVLAQDCADLIENLDDEVLPGGSVDDEAALAAIRRVKAIATATGGRVIPGHDPDFFATLKQAPAYYE